MLFLLEQVQPFQYEQGVTISRLVQQMNRIRIRRDQIKDTHCDIPLRRFLQRYAEESGKEKCNKNIDNKGGAYYNDTVR
jgi:hypothetical protein